jgi:hypothetical protein
MEKITTLTNGQHIIFGMVLSYLTNHLNLVMPQQNLGRLASTIIELDEPEPNNYDLTTSESMEEYMEQIPEIFAEYWERYHEIFITLVND